MRSLNQMYPDFTAETEEIEKNGISDELLNKIIKKHRRNALYNKGLHDRYSCCEEGVSIASRRPRYKDSEDTINNKLNNDFFSDSIDFVVGYMCGMPIAYGYADTSESAGDTGGAKAIDNAIKTITDFVTLSNMHDVDMETVKNLLICGYSGRLFYIDKEGHERVIAVPAYETIIFSKTSICEPQYAVRYYPYWDINGVKRWKAEFYDDENITRFDGTYGALKQAGEAEPHMFDYCPLMGIPANSEMLGHCEKVLSLMLDSWDSGTLDFVPSCPRSIYNMQIKAMTDYIAVLEARAAIEGIALEQVA